jgi:hypothetical protein
MVECPRPARLLSVKVMVRKGKNTHAKDRLTTVDHRMTIRAETPIIAVTTHNQSEAPLVRRRAALDGLTCTGLAIGGNNDGMKGMLGDRVAHPPLYIPRTFRFRNFAIMTIGDHQFAPICISSQQPRLYNNVGQPINRGQLLGKSN